MKKAKKFLSIILACITLLGTSVTAFAGDKTNDANDNVEVVILSRKIED